MSKSVANLVFNTFINDSRVLKESISLSNAGYKVEVIAHLDKDLPETEETTGFIIKRFSYLDRKITTNKFFKLNAYFKYIKKSVNYCKTFDILHCNDLNTLPIAFIIKKFYNKQIKVVYDAHEYEINAIAEQSKRNIKINYYIEKFLIQYADRIITVSNSIADAYVELYGISKPALVLNTPAFKEIFKKNIFRDTFDISNDNTIFLYQGALLKGRGVEILLDTFNNLSDTKAVIIFMGYGELEETIKQSSKRHSNIYFHEAVDSSILLDYTSSADFGISTIEDSCLSYRYSLPNKIFEYLMAKIPIIVSNLPEMKNFVQKNAVGIVVKENSPQGLQFAIKEALLLDQEEIMTQIEKVKKTYNWEEQERILLNLYSSL